MFRKIKNKIIELPPNEIQECFYFLDTVYQVRPERIGEAEDHLIKIYGVSKNDARMLKELWVYVQEEGHSSFVH